MLDASFVRKLRDELATEAVLVDLHHVLVYECDASTAFKSTPEAVVLPQSTDEVAAVVRLCGLHDVPFVAVPGRACPAARRRVKAGW